MPLAIVITIVGYLESISVAKALASRKREKVNANRELFALGMADVGAAFTGGYPVTGGFSRSLVNFSAGVCTPMGSMYYSNFGGDFGFVFDSTVLLRIPSRVGRNYCSRGGAADRSSRPRFSCGGTVARMRLHCW